jgi:hypothetical protein
MSCVAYRFARTANATTAQDLRRAIDRLYQDHWTHLGFRFARARGLKVIAVDARDGGVALSRDYGADFVVDARRG